VRRHRVARGDTLMSIARKYDCSLPELAKANGLKAPRYTVHAGQQIVLRGCGG
jgi:membrane-bound lytic murein transglycosylase D